MKTIAIALLVSSTVLMSACSSVKVVTDYDPQATFSDYKTFAFYKPGIDKAELSDLDKKRILRAIEAEMLLKGFAKSEEPDVLISIFTKERERTQVWNNNPWNPWWGMGNNVSTRVEGVLYIDILDARKNNELVWQGKGTGPLIEDLDEKQERINKIVKQILEAYPPDPNRPKREASEREY